MHRPKIDQLDAFLDRIAQRVERLRHLDLSQDAGREQALTASRQIIGTLALYRSALAEKIASQAVPAPEPVHVLRAA